MTRRQGLFSLLFVALLIACATIFFIGIDRWPVPATTVSVPAGSTIIALNGGGDEDSLLNVYSLDRLLTAVELTKKTPSAKLITTRVTDHGQSTDADQRRIATLADVADRWTILTGDVHTTREEATTLHAQHPDLKSVVVVTSPMHTRRACAVFERVGFAVTCVPSFERSPTAYRTAKQYVYERLAWALYKHRDWVR